MQTSGPALVVLVEDSDPIRTTVSRALVAEGFRVTALPDGAELERELQDRPADLVILDVMLPGRDGFALLDLIRSRTPVPVLMLTARDATADRVRGLTNGADDYLVKPFAMAELIARCRVLLRRSGSPTPAVVIGDLELRDDAMTALRGGHLVELTDTERRLIGYLAARPGRVVTKTQLLTAVWGYDGFDPNVVEVHVSALRRKLEQYGPRMLHTVRGTGYRLGDPDQHSRTSEPT